MEVKKESILTGYPNFIPLECAKKITEQMEKNICKIKIGNEQGTGFFCLIPFPDNKNMLPVFITNNHIINKEFLYKKDNIISIDIEEEENTKEINLNERMKYTNEEIDITIIEIKKEDNIKNYLELDEKILDDIINNVNKNNKYKEETIYIIQYPKGKLSVSLGIIDNIYEDKKYNFIHKCSTEGGSSGSPILSLNNKVLGIHKEGVYNNFNKGAFLNYAIKEFIKENIINYEKDEIISLKNDKDEDNKEILLKEFNKKYDLNIKDTKIDKLDLNGKEIGNEGLEYLSKINFRELKELNLKDNNISDIKMLEKIKVDKLETLDLSQNEISNINVFEKIKFRKLKYLYLFDNNISDIKVLEKIKFDKLEILDLKYNKIDKDKYQLVILNIESKLRYFKI